MDCCRENGEEEEMTDLEKKWAAWTVVTCACAMAAAGLWAALEVVRKAARVFIRPEVCDALEGLLSCALCGVALWICAWECGRRFEREHGGRVCGAQGDDGEG